MKKVWRFLKNLFRPGQKSLELQILGAYALEKLEDLLDVSLDLRDRKIDATKEVDKAKVSKVFGSKIANQFTDSGHVEFKNKLVHTKLSWESIATEPTATITLTRIKAAA